jgi:hypothetical protein
MNEFLVQINNILKNSSLPRHNVAADRELPEDLPPDLWTEDRVWVRRCGHVPPLYDNPYAVILRSLRSFKLQMGRQGGQGLYLLPQPHRRRVRFDLTPQPAAADSGTVFPAQPGRFFERPEEATKSRYPRRQRGPPPKLEGPNSLDSSFTYVYEINWLYHCTQ